MIPYHLKYGKGRIRIGAMSLIEMKTLRLRVKVYNMLYPLLSHGVTPPKVVIIGHTLLMGLLQKRRNTERTSPNPCSAPLLNFKYLKINNMNIDEVLKQKLYRAWPESWVIFEDSCKYSIENNLSFIKGCLLQSERAIEYGNREQVYQELSRVLEGMGYLNIATFPDDQFLTKEGWRKAYVFVCFLSRSAIDAYIKEVEAHNKWGYRNSEAPPKSPIKDAIKNLSIY